MVSFFYPYVKMHIIIFDTTITHLIVDFKCRIMREKE